MSREALRLIALTAFLLSSCMSEPGEFQSAWPETPSRYWIGPEYWANRFQDWRLRDGRLECIGPGTPLRTVHLLTHSLGPQPGDLDMLVQTGFGSFSGIDETRTWSGFLIGAGSPELDYRAQALVHHGAGENGGLIAAIDQTGRLFFRDNTSPALEITPTTRNGDPSPAKDEAGIELELLIRPDSQAFSLTLRALDPYNGNELQSITLAEVDGGRLTGSLALAAEAESPEAGTFAWFRRWELFGTKVAVHSERTFGPIFFTLHTLSRGVLKMTAQMPPVAETDPREVELFAREKGSSQWQPKGRAQIVTPGWTATFRVPEWDASKEFDYRVQYRLEGPSGWQEYDYLGTIRKDPADSAEIVVAAFTGNSNSLGTIGRNFSFSRSTLWFPHDDLVKQVQAHRPDFLVFTGDQIYEGRPTAPDRREGMSSYLDCLYKWCLWGWAYRDLTRDTPAVCLPDDHDVYHGNLWGDGGRKARDLPPDGNYPDQYKGVESYWRQDGGGYIMPAEFVRMAERIQTSHLPDPVDPTPVDQGIGVYFTDLLYGGISFAILEDRKFKSPPSVIFPKGRVVNGFPQVEAFDPREADVPGARLLGERQLEFLRGWATDWAGAFMKVAVSQTIFADVTTYPAEFRTDAQTPDLRPLRPGEYPSGYVLATDMDTNGWPQQARNRALDVLRRGFAFMIAGDQHLGSIVHHGIEDWDDAGYSFCVPSVANLWPRRWLPPEPGANHQEGMPRYTGQYLDGFGNHVTVWAVSNPTVTGKEPAQLYDQAPGYGIVRLNKPEQTITIECWPRHVEVRAPDAKQYPGWPMTISVEDNYGQKPAGYLPSIEVSGMTNPVIQVIDEGSGETVYTVRAKSARFTPKVFRQGSYRVLVGEPSTGQVEQLDHLTISTTGEVIHVEL